MKHLPLIVCAALLGGASLWAALDQVAAPAPPTPPPVVPAPPTPAPVPPAPPCPGPGPCPLKPQPSPWPHRGGPVGSIVIDGPTHAGQDVQTDLPVPQRIHNIGSHVDGAGMCVMSSIEMAARYAGLEQMRGLRDWCANDPGGAWSGKVVKQIAAFCASKGIPVPPYAQYEGPADPAALRSVLAGNRIGCGTYSGRDGVRYRGPIAHMVCIVAARDQVAILDNNDIQDSDLLWMPESDYLQRWPDRSGSVWLFAWLAPGAVPAPKN